MSAEFPATTSGHGATPDYGVEDGHVHMRLKRFNINPFGIGGRYAGMITRISDRAVINVSAGGGLLPSVMGRHRERLLAEEERPDDETAWLRR